MTGMHLRVVNGWRRGWGLLLLAFGGALGLVGCTLAIAAPGAPGIGDPYYEALGNGGYDVAHYAIALQIEPITNTVDGHVTIEATATQPLASFNLDFVGLTVERVTVNSRPAVYARSGRELAVTPARPLRAGQPFSVTVAYHGSPGVSAAEVQVQTGWFHNESGVINVMNEPGGAATWFPANDHPRDKAAYDFDVTVPKPFVAAATGRLLETSDLGARTRYRWQMAAPTASYVAAIFVGDYEIETSQAANGVRVRNYFPTDYPAERRRQYAVLPEMLDYFSSVFGPYPFDVYGVIIAGDTGVCSSMLAQETQTLSVHCPTRIAAEEWVVAHELAHQWFGNSVSLENWQDVWLKEGFATYAEWLWATREEDAEALDRRARLVRSRLRLNYPIGEPSPRYLYSEGVYDGGALVLHALRRRVGEEAFFAIVRTYTERYRYGNAGVDEFIALAEEISGEALQSFFADWLQSTEAPLLAGG